MPFAKCIAAGDVLFCVPKENQKSTRYFRVACATRRADKLVHFLLRECSRRESAAVDAVYHYDLPCEKANQENPQIFLICKYKNNFSDEFAQSNAEGI